MIEVLFSEKDGALVVTPGVKRLDALVANEFRGLVTQKVGDHKVVVIALGRVEFVDSSGLASFISILKAIPPGGYLRLCEANAGIKQMLAVTRLERVFPAFDDLAAALRG